MKITIKPSPTADTRTCDWSKVTREELLRSSLIAAAPDLLAALKLSHENLLGWPKEILDQVEAAIKKAEGE